MARLISPDGSEEEINFYDIGKRFDEIIQNLDEEQYNDYLEFGSTYKIFSPFFDYCILKLGYSIKDPYVEGSLIARDGERMYYYTTNSKYPDKPNRLRIHKMDRFAVGPMIYDMDEFDSGILDRLGNYYTMEGISSIHTTLPIMLVNYTLCRNKELYEEYINYQPGFSRDMCFLEDFLGYVRLSYNKTDDIIFATYSGSMISNKQKNYLTYLKGTGKLDPRFMVDKDKNQRYQSIVHSDKK